ncbi:SRPBCC domain-containing protein, partial [Chloroflexus sp.]|uniref:SRPBCC domain-containing protein n=1 Tax=Chloroflexus sp. TaxID=1904827 RepID=UPI002ACE754E
MKIAGNYTFSASRDEVWAALNDPEVLARTIPGCQRLEQVGENEYESTLKIGLQAVRGVYSGRVKIDNIRPPESYEIHVDGRGSNGFLKGSGSITLREENGQTILDYGGEAHVGGTIASVGQRLLDGAAKTLISQSLKALAAQIEARRTGHATPAPEPVATPAPEPVATPAPEP